MSELIDRVLDAQKYAISIRPKVGGFPVLAEVLRQAGIKMNRWTLPACQSVFLLEEGSVLQQGEPLVTGLHEVPQFDEEGLVAVIRADQAGQSTFSEFLQGAWLAGVVSYDADFVNRRVTYFGVSGESYREEYPSVDLPARA